MYSKTKTCVLNGLNGYAVDVEADLSTGLQAFNIVGLADLSIKEYWNRMGFVIKYKYKLTVGGRHYERQLQGA